MKQVVVTGIGGITSLGYDWLTIQNNLKKQHNAVCIMEDWKQYDGLLTCLGAPVKNFEKPKHYTRKDTRSMGRVSLLSTCATEAALEQAGLLNDDIIKNGSMGIAYGSCTGSTDAVMELGALMFDKSTKTINATTYIKMMTHTCAVNTGLYFGFKGRVIPTASACTSGSQGLGYAYESIKYGKQLMMVGGGAEELCVSQVAVFDTLFATSLQNENPELTPRPFDSERDGLVLGEGACSFILEEREHAIARGATIYAEVVGFATNADGAHVTQPAADTMQRVMEMALEDAQLPAEAIGYVNAHGTATDRGDIAESIATQAVFGKDMPISSLKSYFGHTLGACGSLEAWLSIEMMNNDWYAPTINLQHVDEQCAELDYIVGEGRSMQNEYFMTNNFAFGGINTSLIFKRTTS